MFFKNKNQVLLKNSKKEVIDSNYLKKNNDDTKCLQAV